MKAYLKNSFSILFIACLFILISGCRKTLIIDENTPANIDDLNVSSTFNWKTIRNITLEVTGMNIPVNVKNTFYIKSSDESQLYFKDYLQINQNYTLKFAIPSYETQLVITYGSIKKILEVNADILNFTYLPEEP